LQDPPKFAQIGIFGSKIYVPSGNPARESALIKIELAAAEKNCRFCFIIVFLLRLASFKLHVMHGGSQRTRGARQSWMHFKSSINRKLVLASIRRRRN
jgi:hypothetical protein